MPKQLIYSATYGKSVPLDSPDGGPTTMVELDRDMIKVGWDKARGSVQIATLQTHEGTLIEHGFDGELDGLSEVDVARLTPKYVNLDRAGINELILVLRKARDGAFGKDA